MAIGSKIKKIRELRNFTQEYMADRLSMSQPGYSKIESNEVDLPYSRLEQIASVLQMRVEDVVAFDEKVVFNNYASNQANQAYIINTISEMQIGLYEKTIKLLEDRIQHLEDAIAQQKK